MESIRKIIVQNIMIKRLNVFIAEGNLSGQHTHKDCFIAMQVE